MKNGGYFVDDAKKHSSENIKTDKIMRRLIQLNAIIEFKISRDSFYLGSIDILSTILGHKNNKNDKENN